eukprot:9175931-Alexandrium_andersonii.AAC.1
MMRQPPMRPAAAPAAGMLQRPGTCQARTAPDGTAAHLRGAASASQWKPCPGPGQPGRCR